MCAVCTAYFFVATFRWFYYVYRFCLDILNPAIFTSLQITVAHQYYALFINSNYAVQDKSALLHIGKHNIATFDF